MDTGPQHETYQAALSHLVAWITDGTVPPTGATLELTDDDPVAIVRDELGMGLGGVRNPLVELHGTADEYVAAFRASADQAVAAGFLLPADAEQLIAEAEANRALFG